MIDRLVAAAAGMAAALYIMAASVAWFRVFFPQSSLGPAPSLGKKVIPDRAVAWSALAALFSVVVAVKLSLTEWANQGVDIVLLVASLAVFTAGLVSVRTITIASFGNRALAAFAAVSVAVGLLILLL